MRIGIDARYVYPDHVHGIGRYSVELLRHLVPLASQHELVIFRRRDLEGPVIVGLDARDVPVDAPPVSLGTWFGLGPLARRERLDLFHALFPVVPLTPFPAPRLVVTAHDLQALRVDGFHGGRSRAVAMATSLFYRVSYRAAFHRADRILVGSRWALDDVRTTYGLPEERFRLVPEGLSPRFREAPGAERVRSVRQRLGLSAPYVLNVGNFRPQKNPVALLEGFAAYRRLLDGGDASRACLADLPRELVVVGVQDRFFSVVEERARALGLAEVVRFPGYVSEEDLPAVYAGASIYVTASRHEGFGFTPLEAAACGTPVVAARCGALPEVLGDACLAFDADSPADQGRAILRAVTEPGVAASLIERGRERALGFDWQRTARLTLDAYESLGH